MGLLGSIVGGLTGGLIGGVADHQSAKHNAELSRQNWIYQQSNAHQLEIEDLRKAGLNPVLSATGGHMAGMSPVNPGSSGGAYANAITQAITSSKQLKMQEKLQSRELDIAQTNAETAKAKADTDLFRAKNESELIKSQVGYYDATSAYTLSKKDQVLQDIANSIQLTKAQVAHLRSGTALNYKEIEKIDQWIDESISRADLNDAQKENLRDIMHSSMRKLEKMDAQEQLNFLGSEGEYTFGKFVNDIGNGFGRIGLKYLGGLK